MGSLLISCLNAMGHSCTHHCNTPLVPKHHHDHAFLILLPSALSTRGFIPHTENILENHSQSSKQANSAGRHAHVQGTYSKFIPTSLRTDDMVFITVNLVGSSVVLKPSSH